jgi:hypothetical protein
MIHLIFAVVVAIIIINVIAMIINAIFEAFI